jgi:uncharacterized OB-fold protein
MPDGLILPDVGQSETAPFWAACARGELVVQACAVCGRRRMPPRPMCPWCRSLDARWDVMAGTARVWSFVVAHPPLLPAYAARAPYLVAVVELDDDPSIRLVGGIEAESIAIGDPVRVVFSQVADDVWLPQWVAPVPPTA